jgi:hypothetical protein
MAAMHFARTFFNIIKGLIYNLGILLLKATGVKSFHFGKSGHTAHKKCKSTNCAIQILRTAIKMHGHCNMKTLEN